MLVAWVVAWVVRVVEWVAWVVAGVTWVTPSRRHSYSSSSISSAIKQSLDTNIPTPHPFSYDDGDKKTHHLDDNAERWKLAPADGAVEEEEKEEEEEEEEEEASHPIPSHPIPSHPIPPHPILSHSIPPHHHARRLRMAAPTSVGLRSQRRSRRRYLWALRRRKLGIEKLSIMGCLVTSHPCMWP